MITVFCVCTGDKYNTGYVYALKEAVNKYLTVDHKFICITEHDLPGITTIKPYENYHGWWSKLNLFAPGVATGKSIYLDLDVVITKNIDYLVNYTDKFSAPANWAQSGHGGIQSSVMCWPGHWHLPFVKFDYEKDSKRLWGDQEFLWELLGDDWQKIPNVGSYKYHCRENIPDWLNIMCFHGLPDPHEVKDEWILPFTATLHNLINLNTRNGLKKGLKSMESA